MLAAINLLRELLGGDAMARAGDFFLVSICGDVRQFGLVSPFVNDFGACLTFPSKSWFETLWDTPLGQA